MLVWVNSGSWWWTGRPGMLQFMESQRVGHDWVTDWTEDLSQVLKNERYAATTCMLGAQSSLTLFNPMNGSPVGSPVHGILQSKILEWVAIFFSRGASQSRDPTPGLLHCKQFLYCLNHQVSPTRWWVGGEGWEEHSLPQMGSQNCKPGVVEASLEVLNRHICWILDGVTHLSSTNSDLWLPHLQSWQQSKGLLKRKESYPSLITSRVLCSSFRSFFLFLKFFLFNF